MMSWFRRSNQKEETITEEVHNLTHDEVAQQKFQTHGYSINNVTWEDTARNKNSCWGPNITDQTLMVKENDEEYSMPVIRKPNFTDETSDVPLDQFTLLTGNEEDAKELTQVSLRDYLKKMNWYLERDEKIMLSTQACILPLKKGFCQFGVQLFNYQTQSDDPTLAVIVSSSQGCSTSPITKRKQTLYFNKGGRSHPFEAKRLEEDRKERGVSNVPKFNLTQEEKDRNVLVVFHVPLKPQIVRPQYGFGGGEEGLEGCMMESCMSSEPVYRSLGFDAAVLHISRKDMGEFPSLKPNVKYVRDDRFPIRAVVQYYCGTDSKKVDQTMVEYIVKTLSASYTVTGSHVTGSGPSDRITTPNLM